MGEDRKRIVLYSLREDDRNELLMEGVEHCLKGRKTPSHVWAPLQIGRLKRMRVLRVSFPLDCPLTHLASADPSERGPMMMPPTRLAVLLLEL